MSADPELLVHRYIRASFPQRVGAVLVDSLLFVVTVAVPATLITWWFGPPDFVVCEFSGSNESCKMSPDAIRYTRTVFYLLASVFIFVYAAFVSQGATIGKRSSEVLVVDNDSGATISYGRALIRTLLSIVSLVVFGLGFFFAFTNNKRRTLHDVLTKTRVISP